VTGPCLSTGSSVTTQGGDAVKDLVIVHHADYANWVFDRSHPTQGRRFIHAMQAAMLETSALGCDVEVIEPEPCSIQDLEVVHGSVYISQVIDRHESDEWTGARPDLAWLSQLFVGGTLVALRTLLNGRSLTAAHFPGAKHHAQADRSSGFCVFADFAIAAHQATRAGHRVAILDVDAHHGDGTENLTRTNRSVLTYSVHERDIFPGTGRACEPSLHVHNWPQEPEAGDAALADAVADFLCVAQEFQPTLILVAGGADGHETDPLSSLTYTIDGYGAAAVAVRRAYPDTPILFGGAGGYTPDGATPLVWSRMVGALAGTGAGGAS